MTGSSCGSCTLCCKLMSVPELDKPTCTWCQHAKPGIGCGIYLDRPRSCREFECIWLQSQSRPGSAMNGQLSSFFSRGDMVSILQSLVQSDDRDPAIAQSVLDCMLREAARDDLAPEELQQLTELLAGVTVPRDWKFAP